MASYSDEQTILKINVDYQKAIEGIIRYRQEIEKLQEFYVRHPYSLGYYPCRIEKTRQSRIKCRYNVRKPHSIHRELHRTVVWV